MRQRAGCCALPIAWKHASDPTPPALRSPPRPAQSLARDRFAEKRASGTRPRRVARRSRYRLYERGLVVKSRPRVMLFEALTPRVGEGLGRSGASLLMGSGAHLSIASS